MIKIINYLLQSTVIYIFFLIGRILGIKISRKLFSKIFSLIGPIFKSKEIVYKNLKTFSPELKDQEIEKITHEMWKNYGMTFIEYMFLNDLRNETRHVTIIGKNNINETIRNKKPVIFISGHFGNFELMSMEITKMKIKLATIYRPLNNIFLNPLMEYLRKKYICGHQIKKGIHGVRSAIDYIKNNFSVALMIDQRVSEGEKISFFGKNALTSSLPAQLSLKFNLDIIPVFIERTDDNNFIIEFQKPVLAKNFRNKIELSIELNKIIEKMITRNPNQWIWTHNRWK